MIQNEEFVDNEELLGGIFLLGKVIFGILNKVVLNDVNGKSYLKFFIKLNEVFVINIIEDYQGEDGKLFYILGVVFNNNFNEMNIFIVLNNKFVFDLFKGSVNLFFCNDEKKNQLMVSIWLGIFFDLFLKERYGSDENED